MLNELLLIKFSDGNTLRIIEVVARIWQRIALSLGFDEARIKSIEIGCHYQPEDACREMFGLWLEGDGDLKPATWSHLIQSLRDVNLTEIAVKLSNLVCFEFLAIYNVYYVIILFLHLSVCDLRVGGHGKPGHLIFFLFLHCWTLTLHIAAQ